MATITIDGQPFTAAEGSRALEAALQNGIYIPHLCRHPDLPELGACPQKMFSGDAVTSIRCRLFPNSLSILRYRKMLDGLAWGMHRFFTGPAGVKFPQCPVIGLPCQCVQYPKCPNDLHLRTSGFNQQFRRTFLNRAI